MDLERGRRREEPRGRLIGKVKQETCHAVVFMPIVANAMSARSACESQTSTLSRNSDKLDF